MKVPLSVAEFACARNSGGSPCGAVFVVDHFAGHVNDMNSERSAAVF
jgi:hypothetical protein